jgi:hypothetical protein
MSAVEDMRLRAHDPFAALAGVMPRLTPVLGRHGFVPEGAGRDWEHWVSQEDAKVVIRAYAFASQGGGVSLTMDGAPMPADVERDLRSVIAVSGGS